MEEIKVGEYVRTKVDGFIGKKIKDGLRKGTIEIEDNICSWIIDTYNITKHSPNIIDLIEVGDYVNESKIIDIVQAPIKAVYTENQEQKLALIPIINEQIKSVVTKEQFNQVKYEV